MYINKLIFNDSIIFYSALLFGLFKKFFFSKLTQGIDNVIKVIT